MVTLSHSPFSWPLAVLGKLIPVPKTPIGNILAGFYQRGASRSKKCHYLCSFSLGCIITAMASDLFNSLFLAL